MRETNRGERGKSARLHEKIAEWKKVTKEMAVGYCN